jgi:hypothetical protein
VVHSEYHYFFKDREYISTRFTTGTRQGSSDPGKAERIAARLSPGSWSTCYVNPRHPEQAVLERGEIWAGLFLLGPFLIFGLMAHEEIFAWFEERQWRRRAVHPVPLSETNDAFQLDKRNLLFGVLAIVMGFFLSAFCVIKPLQNWANARHWISTNAVINRAELTSRSGIHGPEYSLEVKYSFNFGGRSWQSTRRSFSESIDESIADLDAWVASHKPGTVTPVFVNPEDPTDAVLDRSIHLGWITLALSFCMLAFGFVMLAQCLLTWWRRKGLTDASLINDCLPRSRPHPKYLRVFPPLFSAGACALLTLPAGAAAAWSLTRGVRALLGGHADVINLLYGAGASVAAGFLLACAFKLFKQACRCRPVLEVTPGTPVVGGVLRLKWKFIGPRQNVGWIRVFLEGFEEAKVRHLIATYHGPMSEEKKERSLFATVPMVEQKEKSLSGSASVAIPAETMHSFTGVKSAITWEIKFEFGKDETETLEYRFPIRLTPAKS